MEGKGRSTVVSKVLISVVNLICSHSFFLLPPFHLCFLLLRLPLHLTLPLPFHLSLFLFLSPFYLSFPPLSNLPFCLSFLPSPIRLLSIFLSSSLYLPLPSPSIHLPLAFLPSHSRLKGAIHLCSSNAKPYSVVQPMHKVSLEAVGTASTSYNH